MKINSPLVQIYFLALRPQDTVDITAQLPALKLGMEHEEHKVGPWMQFSWMGRHGLCILREVSVTSGLDSFFLKDDGLPGIQDVAEVMVFPFQDESYAHLHEAGGLWCRSLEELRKGEFGEALGFVTFVRLNRALLENRELWASAGAKLGVPSLADLLRGMAGALQRATGEACWKEELTANLRLMLTAGCGDSEIVILGTARERDALDKLLFLLARLGADSISAVLNGDAHSLQVPAVPAVTETVTELLVPMGVYGDALKEAVEAEGPEARPSPGLEKRLKNCLKGEVGGQLWLKRGVRSIADLGDAVRDVTGNGWQDLTALGSVDVLVQPKKDKREIHHLLWMLARIDAAAARQPGFPRKVAFHFTFGSAWGQLAHLKRVPVPGRVEMLGFAGKEGKAVELPELLFETTPEDIAHVREFVEELRRLCWREDIRVIERMAERSLAIKKNESLPAETRAMADRCFRRLSLAVQRLRKLEEVSHAADAAGDAVEETLKTAAITARAQAVSIRRYLVEAGMLFDRAVAHHMRGALPLLLQPAFQARGPEHFCSEVILSAGMAAFPRSVAGKMLRRLEDGMTPAEAASLRGRELVDRLRLVASPILYASHDEDFQISPLLGIIRIPRWVLWYPTASSMVVHEVGHSFFDLAHMPLAIRTMLAHLTQDEEGRRMVECLALQPWLDELHLTSASPEGGITPPASPSVITTPPGLRNELEEVCADATWRICCYGREDTVHFVHDYLRHIDGRSARMPELERWRFLRRLLMGVVATEQIMDGWFTGGRSLFPDSREEVMKRLHKIAGDFVGFMRGWVAEHAAPLVPAAGLFLRDVERFCEELEAMMKADGEKDFVALCGQGQFMALLWLHPALRISSSLSRLPWWNASHMVWRALLKSALEISPSHQKQIHRIAQSIIEGRVPQESTPYPERLPTLIEQCCRTQRRERESLPGDAPWLGCEIPVQARFALSIFLQSSI